MGVIMELLDSYQQLRRRRRSLALVAIVTALCLVLGCETADPEVDDNPVIVTGMPRGGGPVEDTRAHDLANLEAALERPALHVGNRVIGQATIYQVVSPHSFWLESGDRRIFTVIVDRETGQDLPELRRGRILQLSGELHTTEDLGPVEKDLDTLSRQVLADEEYYLLVSPNTFEVISRGVAERVQ
jgi:hypothetical protein